jgi:phage tail-like protein
MPNGTQDHFLLNARAGWRAARLDRVVLEEEPADMHLRSLPGTARPLVDAVGSFGGLALPTGLAVDAEDRIYILDSQAHVIKCYNPCTEVFETLPCIGMLGNEPRQLCQPHGLAISCRGDLYVADTGNRRVQVFALKGLPLRSIWGPLQVIHAEGNWRVAKTAAVWRTDSATTSCQGEWLFPEGVWQPWDIALSNTHWAFVSDYANGLIHVFDPWGCWRTAYTGTSTTSPQLEKPTHLALDKMGQLYVAQEGKDYITVLDAKGNFLRRVERPEEVKGHFCPIAVASDAQGNIYISERVTRRVYIYCQGSEACSTCAGGLQGVPGMCTTLAFDRAGNLLLGDAENKCVVRLPAQAAFEPVGHYYSEALDSRIYQCLWHRVLMRAVLPPGTQVQIDTFTAEVDKTAEEIQSLPEARWMTGQVNAQVGNGRWDCLILSPPGRYLWLRLKLIGDGTATPAVQWLTVYYPRASSLQYLPAVYSEDAESRDFLGRFLALFDTLRDSTDEVITHIARYFDPAATPTAGVGEGGADFLAWLASWLDLTLDRHWPEKQRRELLRQAHRLYAWRGTPAGLRLHVQLYTGVEPRLLEHFKLRRWLFLDHARLGEQSAVFGKAIVPRLQLDEYAQLNSFQLLDSGDPLRDPFHYYAHQCTVFVPVRGGVSDVQRRTLERIVDMAKPAHIQARIAIVEPRFRIGIQAFIGLDTVIGHYPNQVIAGEGRLRYDTMLGPSADEAEPPTIRIGVRTRIGSSTVID